MIRLFFISWNLSMCWDDVDWLRDDVSTDVMLFVVLRDEHAAKPLY